MTRYGTNRNFYGSVEYSVTDDDKKSQFMFRSYKNPAVYLEIKAAIQNDKRIAAIKLHRANTGSGLKEAKDYIWDMSVGFIAEMDHNMELLKKQHPEDFI